MIEFTACHVRELKGAPLSCLVLLAISPLPLSREYLERTSGYTDKTVKMALDYLKDMQYIVRSRSGWCLSDGFQLPFYRKNSESGSIIIIDSESPDSIELKVNNNNSRKNSDPLIEDRKNSDNLLSLLRGVGVKENGRVLAMLQMPHVTEDYIQAKIKEHKAAGYDGARWAGLLIKTIEQAEPVVVVEKSPNGHPLDCNCAECSFGKFSKWRNYEPGNEEEE